MTLLGVAGALLTILMAGVGVASFVLRRRPKLNAFELACLSWLFGCATVSILLFISGLFTRGITLQIVVSLFCALIAATGWKANQSPSSRLTFPLPRGILEWILTAIIAFEVSMIFVASARHTLGWDGLLNWEIKARYAFLNGGAMPVAYFADSGRVFSHPEYPLMIPMSELWIYLWIGEPNQFWAKIIFPIFYAVGTCLLVIIPARITGLRWPGLTAAALLFFVPFLTGGTGGVLVGYVDFPLGVFYLGATGYLILAVVTKERSYLIAFATLLALLPWVKREGVMLWLVAAACGAFVIYRTKKFSRTSLLLLLPGAIVVVAWKLYLHALHAVASRDFSHASLTLLRTNADRIGVIFREAATELFRVNDWSIFWVLVLAASLYQLLRRRDPLFVVVLVAVFAPLTLYAITYIFSAWDDYFVHMSTSFPRLVMQTVPLGWLLITLVMRSAAARSGAGP